MIRTLLFLSFIAVSFVARSQPRFTQYFDGADTSVSNSVIIQPDTASSNIWQIGRPQKIIFDSAATLPNAILTDTINNYPPNNTSTFSFRINNQIGSSIIAIRWKQKLDMVKKHSGGYIEFTIDSGKTWKNVFHNSNVYNFYGFDTAKASASNAIDTLNGIYTLSGKDTTWKDIWLCFLGSKLGYGNDSVQLRFTFVSDTSTATAEGWMMDNFMVQNTYFHTVVKNAEEANAIKVYPTVVKDYVHITVIKTSDQQIIKHVALYDTEGKLMKTFAPNSEKYHIDVRNIPDGMYYLKVSTNRSLKTFPVFLKK